MGFLRKQKRLNIRADIIYIMLLGCTGVCWLVSDMAAATATVVILTQFIEQSRAYFC